MKNASGTAPFVHSSLAEAAVKGFLKSTTWRKTTYSFLLLTALFTAPGLWAKTHPVEIPKDTDCATCHEDKAKGKNVHSAIAMGCTSCHEVRVNKDVTRVKLITTTPTALCLSCHADKKAADLKGTVHPPAVRDCVKCHDPHQSDNKNQLLKPTSGDKGQNLCLTCHNQGLDVPKDGSRHAALDMGCETCHTTHKVGDPSKIENAAHLAKPTPALCLDCHDAKSADLIKAHNGQPFQSANCVQCHNPHQSQQAKLMQKFTHVPFESKSCDTCHAAPKDGKVVLTQTDTRALCVTCHSEQAEHIEKAKVQHPGAQGECVTCHNPHAGKTPGFLQPDPVQNCLSCHSDIAELGKKKVHHQPAFAQGCATCHEPHGGDNPKLLRAQGNALCLECHGPNRNPAKLDKTDLVTIFNGRVRLPQDYFTRNKATRLDLKYGLGHPVRNHPVESVRDPMDPTKNKVAMSCLTCHQPHAAANEPMLVGDQRNNQKFCNTCHKSAVGEGQ